MIPPELVEQIESNYTLDGCTFGRVVIQGWAQNHNDRRAHLVRRIQPQQPRSLCGRTVFGAVTPWTYGGKCLRCLAGYRRRVKSSAKQTKRHPEAENHDGDGKDCHRV